jgi:hypothetical protein
LLSQLHTCLRGAQLISQIDHFDTQCGRLGVELLGRLGAARALDFVDARLGRLALPLKLEQEIALGLVGGRGRLRPMSDAENNKGHK